MTREIKFRAFWKDTLKLIPDFNEQYTIDACNGDEFFVNQFTGLKDKNGVEIYEGDILLQTGIGRSFQIKYEIKFGEFYNGETYEDAESGYGYYLHEIGCNEEAVHCVLQKPPKALMEVIGNIYQNPELLK